MANEKDERMFYNANDVTYGYLRNAEKDVNDEISKITKIMGEDFAKYFMVMHGSVKSNIIRKFLGLSYDHYYERRCNDRIDQIYELAKSAAIRYIENEKQEDYDKAKKLLNEYKELNKYRLVEVENLWNCVDDKVYEVITNEDGERVYKIFDLDTFFSEAK